MRGIIKERDIKTCKPTKKGVKKPKKVLNKKEKDMREWIKRIVREVVREVLGDNLKLEERIMALLTEAQQNAIALQAAQIAEQARQDAKNVALQAAVDGVTATLTSVQAELDALKAGGQTPENQAIIDDINAKILDVTSKLNAEAV